MACSSCSMDDEGNALVNVAVEAFEIALALTLLQAAACALD